MISQKGDPTLRISNKGFSPRNIAGIGKDARKLWAANAVPVGATAGVTSYGVDPIAILPCVHC